MKSAQPQTSESSAPRTKCIKSSRIAVLEALKSPEKCGFHFQVSPREHRQYLNGFLIRKFDGNDPPPLIVERHVTERQPFPGATPSRWDREIHIRHPGWEEVHHAELTLKLTFNLERIGFKSVARSHLDDALYMLRLELEEETLND